MGWAAPSGVRPRLTPRVFLSSQSLPLLSARDETSTTSARHLHSPQKTLAPVQVRIESSQDSASRDGAVSPLERSGVQSEAIRVQVAGFLQDELERLARVVKRSGYD